jgi:hypothetical protein
MCCFLRPFIWSRVSGLMRFRDGSDKGTASHFVQMSGKHSTKILTKITQTFGKESVSRAERIRDANASCGAEFNFYILRTKLKSTLRGVSSQTNYRPSDRHLSAKLVPTFEDGECHVLSLTDVM